MDRGHSDGSGKPMEAIEALARGAAALESTQTVIQLQRDQLGGVNELTEQAAIRILQSLQGVVQQADALAQIVQASVRAADMLGRDSHTNEEVGNARLQTMREKFARRAAARHKTEEALAALGVQMKSIKHRASLIVADSVRVRILALNARIEATRAAQGQNVMTLLADELKTFVQESTTNAEIIENATGSLGALTQTFADQESAASAEDAVLAELFEDFAQFVLDARETSERAREQAAGVVEVEAITLRLRELLALTVSSIQFQDVVRQRIAHVTESMGEVQRVVGTASAFLRGTGSAEDVHALDLAALTGTYHMDSQRAVHSQSTGGPAVQEALPDIEFF